MPTRIQRWLRTLHTIKYLKPRQAWYFFLRRGIGSNKVGASPQSVALKTISLPPVLQLTHLESDWSEFAFTFLNHSLHFSRTGIDWCPHQAQRLWRYNLHYFDFLRESSRPLSQKVVLIDDWIARNPQGTEPAWEPYTTSLRIVNWCVFFWTLPSHQIRQEWLCSLHMQARWLERNLELHILANHYFENIKALLFAALSFDDSHSVRWLKRFQSELVNQLREQTLSDGGHYERSPQYHCILLECYIDIYALFGENPEGISHETFTTLRQTIDAGIRFLAAIVTPDDDIPLFNDSASGSASRPSSIFAKARQLGFTIEVPQRTLINLPNSGLFGWKCDGDYFLIDCGDIGPSYQPGHTHCDFLSYVLMVDHRWLVVDSGVSEYEPGVMRTYVRTTAAHNTVVIDDSEQSEIWGEFRVGRRARSLSASIEQKENSVHFQGAFIGFPALNGGLIHRRSATLRLSTAGLIQCLSITDRVEGTNLPQRQVRSLLHFHPHLDTIDIDADELKANISTAKSTSTSVLHSESKIRKSNYPSWHCPEFGLKHTNTALEVSTRGELPLQFSYELTPSRTYEQVHG